MKCYAINKPTDFMHRGDLLDWLRTTDPERLAELWRLADQTRRRTVGDQVHLRGLIEVSNYCRRQCGYCGLRADHRSLARYRMSDDEVMGCVRQAVEFGYGTVVLQSGEDLGLSAEWVAGLVRRIKAETPLAVTLSLGEREPDELALWRDAGADRYLLRFETSNRALYERIHPSRPGQQFDRFELLGRLLQLGYEVGSGVMIGIPGQTYDDLADDLEWFARLKLDMIGVGPYLRHPETPLAAWPEASVDEQAPATERMTYKVVALARLMCPWANIPATTALATLNIHEGRELGLLRGANVVMPNLTPTEYRTLYEIYPGKACMAESGRTCHRCLAQRIAAIGRTPGQGRGDAVRGEVFEGQSNIF
ncbi:MAG: [FeFe] hydrogenase H-cluster radical SAM maturase HydE [Planctomycetaceae bacterium]|nr:[FeFe] hydrogenase H-cluster radical SAM maturase HydE [Planctomycetaceae bacterium]